MTPIPVTLMIEGGRFEHPVWVDVVTGNVYEIPADSVSEWRPDSVIIHRTSRFTMRPRSSPDQRCAITYVGVRLPLIYERSPAEAASARAGRRDTVRARYHVRISGIRPFTLERRT